MTAPARTISEVRALMRSRGLATNKRHGQNFLIDPSLIDRIVTASGVTANDEVLEIGPGLGALTFPLAEVARRVVTVEIDAGLATVVAEMADGRDDVEVVHADALRVDLSSLVGPGAKLVANLPYNVATPLVVEACKSGRFAAAFVMVQLEVGERWAATPGDPTYAGVSAKLALLADVQVAFRIPRQVFFPQPNVDSVMVRLTVRPDVAAMARVCDLIDVCFASRRKTLRNNLMRTHAAERVEAALAATGIDGGVRAEELEPRAFVSLSAALG